MIIGKDNIGTTIQIRKHKQPGSLSLTVHGYTQQEIYNKILFLFQSLERQEGDVHLTMYNTKTRQSFEGVQNE